jgi:hypothetical protein
MESWQALGQHSKAPMLHYSNRIRLTGSHAFSCYRVSAGRIAPRKRVSFELDSAANK